MNNIYDSDRLTACFSLEDMRRIIGEDTNSPIKETKIKHFIGCLPCRIRWNMLSTMKETAEIGMGSIVSIEDNTNGIINTLHNKSIKVGIVIEKCTYKEFLGLKDLPGNFFRIAPIVFDDGKRVLDNREYDLFKVSNDTESLRMVIQPCNTMNIVDKQCHVTFGTLGKDIMAFLLRAYLDNPAVDIKLKTESELMMAHHIMRATSHEEQFRKIILSHVTEKNPEFIFTVN